MKQKTSQTLYAYWNDVRRGRMAPRRFEIEPSRIGDILPETFILERADADSYPFRLAGTRLCEQFGAEFRGTDFLAGWSAEDRISLRRQLATMGEQGAVGLLVMEAGTADGRSVEFEVIILPLIHTRETVDRYLGAMSPSHSPSWLGSERLTGRRMKSLELIWPDGRPHTVIEKLDRQVPFLPHVRNARIVRSDRRQFRVYDGGLNKNGSDER